MLFIENNNQNPYYNHALEEWLMENYSDDCFMLWRNQKAILLGRNQNAYSEVNIPYSQDNGIKVVRRITGGGAVCTDEGNIMFTFISADGRQEFANFRKFTEPVLSALRDLGIPATGTGRNDLTIGGKKFSGNAQCLYGDKLLHHGTLMYQADLDALTRALKVSAVKLQGKGVSSVRSHVTNLCEHMAESMDIEDFRTYLLNSVMKSTADARLISISVEEWEKIKEKAKKKHETAAWIWGHNPTFDLQKETKFPGGIIQVHLTTTKGRIKDISLFGDFFSDKDISEVENALMGVLYETESLTAALSKLEMEAYFNNISLDELICALL